MSMEFLIFTIAILVLIAARNWEKLSGVQTIAGGAVSGIRGIFSSLLGKGKGVWDVVGARVVGFVLWVFVLVSFRALFPEAFAAWWGHQNIFWISQLVAVLLIFFLPAKYSAPLFGLVIAVLLWSAINVTFVPQPPKEALAQRKPVVREKIVVKKTVLPGEWEFVSVPDYYTAFYSCDNWGEVEIPGSGRSPKGCGPRGSRNDDAWGTLHIKSGLVLAFTPSEGVNDPVNVTVTMVPVKKRM